MCTTPPRAFAQLLERRCGDEGAERCTHYHSLLLSMHWCHAGQHAKAITLCYAVLCYAILCYAMLRYATLWYGMVCYAMLCYATLCCAMLCYAKAITYLELAKRALADGRPLARSYGAPPPLHAAAAGGVCTTSLARAGDGASGAHALMSELEAHCVADHSIWLA